MQENEAAIREVAAKLRASIEALCDKLKDNPNVAENMAKVSSERQGLQGLLSKSLEELLTMRKARSIHVEEALLVFFAKCCSKHHQNMFDSANAVRDGGGIGGRAHTCERADPSFWRFHKTANPDKRQNKDVCIVHLCQFAATVTRCAQVPCIAEAVLAEKYRRREVADRGGAGEGCGARRRDAAHGASRRARRPRAGATCCERSALVIAESSFVRFVTCAAAAADGAWALMTASRHASCLYTWGIW